MHCADHVCASDVMYIDDAVIPLGKTLAAVSGPNTIIYLSHGRNRQAEASFMRAVEATFSIEEVPDSELHEVYQTGDVTVLRLHRRPRPSKRRNQTEGGSGLAGA